LIIFIISHTLFVPQEEEKMMFNFCIGFYLFIYVWEKSGHGRKHHTGRKATMTSYDSLYVFVKDSSRKTKQEMP